MSIIEATVAELTEQHTAVQAAALILAERAVNTRLRVSADPDMAQALVATADNLDRLKAMLDAAEVTLCAVKLSVARETQVTTAKAAIVAAIENAYISDITTDGGPPRDTIEITFPYAGYAPALGAIIKTRIADYEVQWTSPRLKTGEDFLVGALVTIEVRPYGCE